MIFFFLSSILCCTSLKGKCKDTFLWFCTLQFSGDERESGSLLQNYSTLFRFMRKKYIYMRKEDSYYSHQEEIQNGNWYESPC